MIKKYLLAFFIAALMILVITGQLYFMSQEEDSADSETIISNCFVDQKACEIEIENTIVTVSVDSEIKALSPFQIYLIDSNQLIKSAFVDLSMEAMDMGLNQFRFDKNAQGLWQSKVVIPVCTRGRRDWRLDLHLQIRKANYQIVIWLQV